MSANRLVIAAPIWAQGPSFPTEPPKASVTTVARSLIGATFHGIRPDSRWTAAMTASVPWPRAVGANVRIRSTHAGSASGRSHVGEIPPGVTRFTHVPDAASDHRNARVPKPTQRPAAAPSNAHFSVLMTSAVCSVYQRVSSASLGGGCPSGPHRQRAVTRKCPRRFWAQAASSWPVANGRSLPYEIVCMRERVDAEGREVLPHRGRAALSKRHIVRGRPALVAMPFDADLHRKRGSSATFRRRRACRAGPSGSPPCRSRRTRP